MNLETAARLSAVNVGELESSLARIFAHGANLIVGWHLAANGIKVLHLPSYALSSTPGFSTESLTPSKFLKTEAEFHHLSNIGARVTSIPLSFDVPNEAKTITAVDQLIRRYSITHRPWRCVSLFDIVGFSTYAPIDRITLITMLSHHITVAADKCRQLELPVEIGMTTTGDGFYVWNDRVGLGADVALYSVTMLALTYNYAALGVARAAAVPNLRCCIGFGEHYEYYQHRTDSRDPQCFIVGDVTIELARMMSAAIDNQILIGGHQRPTKDGRVVDTPAFVKLAQSGLDRLIGMQIPGGEIAEIKSYLTGERIMDGDFGLKHRSTVDKHDIPHSCFNAKLKVTDRSGGTVLIGRLDGDLEGFTALSSVRDGDEVAA